MRLMWASVQTRPFRSGSFQARRTEEGNRDLELCCPFMVIALIAALLGFSGIAAGMAQVLFWSFFALFLVSLVMGWRQPPLQ